jgi:O-acetyl-ADP-ribose deacetylase (regulator of RNase III)
MIRIEKISITELNTDAIVNAANEHLLAGGGVCGVIFREAGYEELQAACDKIGHCNTGDAVITPGFRLAAKYVIHAVGPIWYGGGNNEPELLYGAYMNSLKRAREAGCHSIGFPLISSGIYGYPMKGAWEQAIKSCKDFSDENPDWEMEIVFAVLSEEVLIAGMKELRKQIDGE